jgi:pSer/pThr/pTyr-binding forkhead associated (FHA) protein
MSAEDNAWFDNPVMSREHAELVFDPEEMVCSDVRFLSTNLLILI